MTGSGAERDLDLLAEAAEAAGRLALAHRARGLEVVEKPDGQGPVTDADLAVDRLLHTELMAARPGYGWLSEETADTAHRMTAERVFIVDPIDGTRAFVAGEAGFAVALAVAEAGRITAAVVHLPARGETFAAALGGGARKNGAPIRVSGRADLGGARALAARAMLEPRHWPGGAPPVERHFRPSLAWRLCLVAEAGFDLMATLRPTWEWDVAAGSLIAAEAGATVTTADGGRLCFNSPAAQTPGVIAAPARLHRRLMALRTGAPGEAIG